MSKGNRVICVRFEASDLEEMGRIIEARNLRAKGPEWTLSDFIRVATREKLEKMQRSRSRARKQPRKEES